MSSVVRMNQNGSAGVAKGDCRVRFSEGARFSLPLRAQTASGAPQASYMMGTWGDFPGGRAAVHSPQSSADAKNSGAMPPLPACSHGIVLN